MTGKLETRPATRADILKVYGRLPGQTIRAKVLLRDDEPVGVAGYYVEGGVAVVFSDATQEIPKQRIWREAVKFMRDMKIPAICEATPGSEAFLERLGWEFAGMQDDKGVFKWRPS